MGRRKRVDEVKAKAGKLGVKESTRLRQYDRNFVRLVKENHPDVARQIDELLPRQKHPNVPRQNRGVEPHGAGIIDPVKADLGATQLTLYGPRKDPKRGVGGFRKTPRNSSVKGKTNSSEKTVGNKKTGRVRRPIWDVLVEVFPVQPDTPVERGRIGRLERLFKAKGATADEIRIRAKRYQDRPGYDIQYFTGEAIFKCWDSLGAGAEAVCRGEREKLTPAEVRRKAQRAREFD